MSMKNSDARRVNRRVGYTLPEVLIVVSILGIAASVGLTTASSFSSHPLESAGRILAADLRLARSLAIKNNTEWAVQFDFDSNSYELIHVGAGNPPAAINPLDPSSRITGKYIIEFDRVASAGFSGAPISIAGAGLMTDRERTKEVVFRSRGGTGPAISQDTVIWLTQNTGKDIRFVRVVVSWVTGEVFVDPAAKFGANVANDVFREDT